MIVGKFGEEEREDGALGGVRDGFGWKAIISGWKDFKSKSCIIVGNRRGVKFKVPSIG